jgi:uncharacterized protein (DUF302 family)
MIRAKGKAKWKGKTLYKLSTFALLLSQFRRLIMKGVQKMTDYGFSKTIDVSYETAIEKVTAALKEEGFGVLTTIDVKETLKQKLDVDFRKYVILGACNPPLAYKTLQTETEIGLLLPCNVIVYENDDGKSVVSAIAPMRMVSIVENPALEAIAKEVSAKLRNAIENV